MIAPPFVTFGRLLGLYDVRFVIPAAEELALTFALSDHVDRCQRTLDHYKPHPRAKPATVASERAQLQADLDAAIRLRGLFQDGSDVPSALTGPAVQRAAGQRSGRARGSIRGRRAGPVRRSVRSAGGVSGVAVLATEG